MKPTGISRTAVVAGVVGLHVFFGTVFRFVVIPSFLPPAMPFATRLTLLVFGVGLLACLVCVFGALALAGRSDKLIADFLDAIRIPFIVVDDQAHCLFLNAEAERTLGLSRKTDLGSPVPSDLAKALIGSTDPLGDPDPRCVIRRGDSHFHVMDHLLSGKNGARERVVVLRNVSARARMSRALTELTNTIEAVADNTMKISDTSVTVSQGASRQANSLSAISASLDEFSKRIQGNTESAEKGTKLAAQAREAAERSGNEIANALTAMTDVQEAGVRIARIVKLIDDIAFQTNLLALNAAVEAARAGRQGKGFAVVADEVRNLAGRSAKAAKDTASMVEDVTERIGNASVFITKLEEMLRNIVQDAIRMADSSASATATSSEQATAILQVNRELGQMNSVTQSTQSAAEESAGAVERLADQVKALKQRLADLQREFNQRQGDGGRTSGAAAGGAASEYRMPRVSVPLPQMPPMPAAIDLVTEPSAFGADPHFAGYSSQKLADSGYRSHFTQTPAGPVDMEAFEEPFKRMAENWNANAASGETPQETRTDEGDRIVKPGQNIKLDDAEFGRY